MDVWPTSVSEAEDADLVDVKVFDGSAIVGTLLRGDSTTFGEYSANIFVLLTSRQLQECERIDVVWEASIEGSLKEATLEKRKTKITTKMPVHFAAQLPDCCVSCH